MGIFPYEPPSDFQREVARSKTLLAIVFPALLAYGVIASGLDFPAMARGLAAIVVSPDTLINDYASVAGLGPAFVNAAFCVLAALGLVKAARVSVSGAVIAAVFTIAGFALFGKNVANIWPGFLGAYLYALASRRPFGENIVVALFGTALAPLSSEMAFGLGVPVPWNYLLAVAVGAGAGFVLSPVSRHTLDFHRGYNLYNTGFAAGFIGTVTMSTMRAFDVRPAGGFQWAELGPWPVLPCLAAAFVAMIAAGMAIDRGWMHSYRRLCSASGRLVSDFVRFYGFGATLVNMGVMGLLTTLVMLAIGASWNGPMIGGLLTIVGFSAFGKHPRNTLPPMLGVATMAMMTRYGLDSPGSQLAVLFASTLAPVSGEYGPVAGFAVGMLHLVLVQVVGSLHGGLNLYNNGFAGGLAAGLILPVLEWMREWRRHEV